MDQIWERFLLSEGAVFHGATDIDFPVRPHESPNFIYPVPELVVLTVSGSDAAKFLQGQITCNINDVSESQSSLGAFCNPKGRVITTFLLVKAGGSFLMVLPKALLDIVKKRLQMYVLRSNVVLTDSSGQYALFGVSYNGQASGNFATKQQDAIAVSFPSSQVRVLFIAELSQAISLWQGYVNGQSFVPASSGQWAYHDIMAGIPWLRAGTSEEFIPQMLNLDKLGGISFNKGCYTGQEIVARTHYLGQAKRHMYLAECQHLMAAPEPGCNILDDQHNPVGKVLSAQVQQEICKMLIVLQTLDGNNRQLKLDTQNQNSIVLLEL